MSIRSFLFILGFLFIGLLLVHSWDKLQILFLNIHVAAFSLSIIIGIFGNFITSALFQQLLAKYDITTSYATACQLFFFAQVTKYIPGKIWVIWYQTNVLKTVGATQALIFTNLDLMGVLLLHTTVLTLSLLILNYNPLLSLLFFSLGLIGCSVAARFCYIFQIIELLLSRCVQIRQKVGRCHAHFTFSQFTWFYILFSMTYVSSQLIMLNAVFGFSLAESSNYIAYLGLAWVAGVLSIIVPGGMGVKEFFFIFFAHLSNQNISLDTLTAIAVIARFWLILQEILGVAIIFLWRLIKISKK
jgi:hypothetical protein